MQICFSFPLIDNISGVISCIYNQLNVVRRCQTKYFNQLIEQRLHLRHLRLLKCLLHSTDLQHSPHTGRNLKNSRCFVHVNIKEAGIGITVELCIDDVRKRHVYTTSTNEIEIRVVTDDGRDASRFMFYFEGTFPTSPYKESMVILMFELVIAPVRYSVFFNSEIIKEHGSTTRGWNSTSINLKNGHISWSCHLCHPRDTHTHIYKYIYIYIYIYNRHNPDEMVYLQPKVNKYTRRNIKLAFWNVGVFWSNIIIFTL